MMIPMRTSLVTVFLILNLAAIVQSALNCTEFPEVRSDEYETTFADINNITRRPNGFLRSTVVYNSQANPCFRVQGVINQALEIKFETVPAMTLCVEDLATNTVRCESGRFSQCTHLSSSTEDFHFFCDVSKGCSEADVTFWVRITKGPLPSEDTEMRWCEGRSEDYPGSLATLPPWFTPRPDEGGPAGAANACAVSFTLAVVCNVFLLLCRRHLGHL